MRILNTTQVSGAPNVLGWLIIIIMLASLLSMIIFHKRNGAFIASLAVVLVFQIVNLVCGVMDVDPFSTKITQYECILEDGGLMIDIPPEYEVVDIRGDIIVLEDKDDANQ